MLEILTHHLLWHATWWDFFFFTKYDVNLLLNVGYAYFVYSHQRGGITCEHWLTDILLVI